MCNTGRDACIVGVDIVNTYYGRANITLGSFKGRFGSYTDNGQDWHYVNALKAQFPHTVTGRDDVPSALEVYTKALQQAANKSVTIASIGETTNLQDLLRSDLELVRAKVKRVVYMDGDFNFGCARGTYGPNDECWESAQYVVATMPSPDVEQIFQLHGNNHNGWWVGNTPRMLTRPWSDSACATASAPTSSTSNPRSVSTMSWTGAAARTVVAASVASIGAAAFTASSWSRGVNLKKS